MTWFQLLEREEPEPPQPERLVPNSAFFLNPALVPQKQDEPAPERKPHLLRLAQ